jgi:hypothetical protein
LVATGANIFSGRLTILRAVAQDLSVAPPVPTRRETEWQRKAEPCQTKSRLSRAGCTRSEPFTEASVFEHMIELRIAGCTCVGCRFGEPARFFDTPTQSFQGPFRV